MSVVGDVLGYINDGRAAKSISDANIAAEHGILTATGDAQNAINAAIKSGQGGVNTAVGNAYTDVNAATAAANGTLADTFNRQSQSAFPYMDAGAQGVTGLEKYAASNPQFTFNPDQYFNSDAYKFQLKQGQDAITNTMAAQGLGNSGAALKELTQYGQGLASTYYNQAFQQAQSQFQTNQNATMQNLGALVNAGEYGTNIYNTAAMNAGNRISGNLTDAAKFLSGEDVQAQEFNSSTGLQGEEEAGRLGMQGSKMAGDYAVQAGTAHAGGILGQGNNLAGMVGDIASMWSLFL